MAKDEEVEWRRMRRLNGKKIVVFEFKSRSKDGRLLVYYLLRVFKIFNRIN